MTPSIKRMILTWMLIVIIAIATSNIVVIYVAFNRKLARLQLGMTEKEVIHAVGAPSVNTVVKYFDESSGQSIHIEDKRHYRYYFYYIWDYILLFPLRRAKGIQVILGEDGRVEQIETSGYLSRSWYVLSSES